MRVHNASAGPYQAQPGEVIDPTQIPVYRGGTSLQVRPQDVKIDRRSGLVQPTHGLSIDSDPGQLQQFGGAHRVLSIPPELKIMQRGQRRTHFELVPRSPMPLQMYRQFVSQVILDSTVTT